MTRFPIGLALVAVFMAAIDVKASIIVDHQPFPSGGPGSDMLFEVFGQPVWQQVADDFVWNSSEQLTGVNFWGFYNADNPPAFETMRVRIYTPRASDGLPGQVKFELAVQNPFRSATGRLVQTGISPNEYLFEVPLPSPVDLVENENYWLEVVQLGDITTNFRWETSVTDDNGHGYRNQFVSDWQIALSGADQAFQLISPEPTFTGLLIFLVLFLFTKRSWRCA